MHQVLIPLPIWLFLHVERAGRFRSGARPYLAVVVACVAAVAFGRIVEWNSDISSCKTHKCWSYLPVAEWANELRAAGLRGGTIIGADYQLSGNLRALLPGTRVIDQTLDAPLPRLLSRTGGPCIAVWRDKPYMPAALAGYLRSALQAQVPSGLPQGAFRHPLLKSDNKASTLYFRRLPASGLCR
jgi:hypothetical protein